MRSKSVTNLKLFFKQIKKQVAEKKYLVIKIETKDRNMLPSYLPSQFNW